MNVCLVCSLDDALTAAPAIAYAAAADAVFPLGETIVTATATDDAGNFASCSFRVTVADTTPPAIVCPANVSVVTPKKDGTNVTFPAPSATDTVTASPQITASPPSGSVFPVGTTAVTGTAVHDAGNTGTCTFEVTVARPGSSG